MYCTNCGKPINDGSKFCPYCGAQVAASTETENTEVQIENVKKDNENADIGNEDIESVISTNQSVYEEKTEPAITPAEQPACEEDATASEIAPDSGMVNIPLQGSDIQHENATETMKTPSFSEGAKSVEPQTVTYAQNAADNGVNQQNTADTGSTGEESIGSKLRPIVDTMNKGLNGLGYFGLGVVIVLIGIYMVISGHWITVAAIIAFLLVLYGIIKISNDRARLIVLALCVLIGVFSWFFTGTNKYVSQIQGSTFTTYTSKTIGKAFDDFFANPQWDYEGKNADGDRVVIFSGRCSLLGEPVTAKIEFTIDDRGSNSSFGITSLKFNNVEQSDLMIVILLNEIYE